MSSLNSHAAPVLLIRNTNPAFYGGAETYQLKLAAELQKHHYQPVIVSSSQQLLTHARAAHFSAIPAPYCRRQNWSGWRNLLLPIYCIWQFRLYFWYRRLFKRLRPLAINIQSRDDWIAATLAARHLGITILWTDHIDFRTWVLTNVNRPHKNPIGKYLLRLATIPRKIIFISDFERQAFERAVSPRIFSNLLTIKNGTTDQFFHYRRVHPAPQSICYVGRLVPYKGIQELLTAFRQISPDFPRATLHIYGNGDPDLIALAQSTPQVAYHGFTDDPLSAIAASQIFVLPSHREGLSLSLLDAAMLGRAIIASDVDGNPEVVQQGKTGLLIPAHDPAALAAALTQLLRSPRLCQKYSTAIRRSYEQNFDFAHIVATQFLPLLEPAHQSQ